MAISTQHHDLLIIGAGLSGIGTACHLKAHCPNLDFAILERRAQIGGTWDLFRYPGIRSDSDMLTFGFSFRPWNGTQVLADGDSIRNYIRETAEAFDVTGHIRYGVDLQRADWDSESQRWTLTSTGPDGEVRQFTCRYLVSCTGYYDYRAGYLPQFDNIEDFTGSIVHPQHWPQDLDCTGKRIAVIGSGATAVTLVPALAREGAQVTMVQRSPTYIMSMPARDGMLEFLSKYLPEKWLYRIGRWRNLRLHRLLFKAARRWPRLVRALMLRGARKALDGSANLPHFTPDYAPWDQRLCAVPDGDLFEEIKRGRANVVTDHIERFTPDGLRLKSGKEITADIIVTATGLQVQLLGGMSLHVDGKPVEMHNRLTYKGVLMEGVPNMAWVFGYTNAAWTLKSDLSADYLCRLLNHMAQHNQGVFKPEDREGCAETESVMAALQSGYVQRADKLLPRQGSRYPWRLLNDYEKDKKILQESPIDDGILQFTAHKNPEVKKPEAALSA